MRTTNGLPPLYEYHLTQIVAVNSYADRDGHIMYVYNANVFQHSTGSYEFWQGVVPGDDSSLISDEIVPFEKVPKTLDPPTGW